MSYGFSILICCFNSFSKLRDTVEHLCLLNIPEGMNVEIILIDNASTDATFQLMQDLKKQVEGSFQMTIQQEPKPGLSYARMMGMNLARYKYILLCDDDNWLRPDYLVSAAAIMERDPQIGMLGGCGIYMQDSAMPAWSKNIKIFALGPQGENNSAVDVLYGAGVILRKDIFLLLKSINFEFLLSDRVRDNLSSGGDYELSKIVRIAGYKLWYSDKLLFEHHFDRQRFEFDYFKRFTKESSSALDILSIYNFVLLHPDGNYIAYLRFFFRQWLFEMKEFMLCYLKYATRSKQEPDKPKYYFKFLFHQYRIYYMIRFFSSARGYFEKVKKLEHQLKSSLQIRD